MEKSYKFVYHDSPLSVDEIRLLYKGYWVYLVNTEFDEFHGLVCGRPVVIGTIAFAGAEDGIYDKYRASEYGRCADKSLLPNRGFISALRYAGDLNA